MTRRRIVTRAESVFPVIVRGAPFEVRTFWHPKIVPDEWGCMPDRTLDQVVTVTLACVPGLKHRHVETMRVVLT